MTDDVKGPKDVLDMMEKAWGAMERASKRDEEDIATRRRQWWVMVRHGSQRRRGVGFERVSA